MTYYYENTLRYDDFLNLFIYYIKAWRDRRIVGIHAAIRLKNPSGIFVADTKEKLKKIYHIYAIVFLNNISVLLCISTWKLSEVYFYMWEVLVS